MIPLILWIVIRMDGLKRSMIALALLALVLVMAVTVAAQAYNRSTVTPAPSTGSSHNVQEREQRGDMQGGAGMPGGMNPYWPVNVSMPPRVKATVTPVATRVP